MLLGGVVDDDVEAAEFGIKVTIIDPAGYATDWGGSSAMHAQPDPAYDAYREKTMATRAKAARFAGDPAATAAAVLQLVDAEEPPLRVFFGKAPLAMATKEYERRLATWREWEQLSIAAHGD